MLDKLEHVCGAKRFAIIFKLAAIAQELEYPAYLVGGMLRDLLLDLRSEDIDIMLDGDAPDFVRSVYQSWSKHFPELPRPKKPQVYRHYRTAKLRFADSVVEDSSILQGVGSVDFSSSRKESYPVAGGKPEISPGDLHADLLRRDFTINALALCLNDVDGNAIASGELVDICGGIEDLEKQQIRVLHEKSFVDDPARLIRAVRFSTRFNFSLEANTVELVEQAVGLGCLSSLPRQRLAEEYRKASLELDFAAVNNQLAEFGLLEQIEKLLGSAEL